MSPQFQFVNAQSMLEAHPNNPEVAFAIGALMEIPEQFREVNKRRLVGPAAAARCRTLQDGSRSSMPNRSMMAGERKAKRIWRMSCQKRKKKRRSRQSRSKPPRRKRAKSLRRK